jgi:hypothetical protein
MLAKVREEAEAAITRRFEYACREPFERLHKAIAHMHERLADPKAGFHDTLVGNLRELLAVLPALNITKNPELDRIARDARKLIVFEVPGVFGEQNLPDKAVADRLKDDPQHREVTASKAGDLLRELNQYMGGAGN